MTIRPVVFALVALAWSPTFSACVLPPVGDSVIRCAAGDVCPDDLRCVLGPDGGTCRPTAAPCVVDVGGVPGEADNGTPCSGGICVAGACVAPVCGDGLVSAGETCDGDVDGCREDCTRCGDGAIDAAAGETCDNGDANSDTVGDACRTTCVEASCGDGVVDPGEECDDGVANADDVANACRTACVRAACGDAVEDLGEACDDGNVISGDRCRGDCGKVEACGDHELDEGEACDDGNDNSRDGCRDCRETTWGANVAIPGRSGGRAALLTAPRGVAIDAVGGIYVADTGGHRVLRVDPACLPCADGDECAACVVSVIAGTGVAGFDGDGGPANLAELRGPSDVVVAPDGKIYIADTLNDRIRVVDVNGVVETFVGGADKRDTDGDGLVGALVALRRPRGLGLGRQASTFLLVAEEAGGRIRAITAGGRASTLVGGGVDRKMADGADSRSGTLQSPVDVVESVDNIYIAETGAGRIRKVRAGFISTVAGGGGVPPSPDAAALAVRLDALASVALLDNDTLAFSDQVSRRLWRVDLATGTLSLEAGNGATVPTEDGAADTRGLGRPAGIAVDDGRVFFADEGQHLARSVVAGQLARVLGTADVEGSPVEGAAATSVTIGRSVGLVELADGSLLIADSEARLVARREPDGLLAVTAGTGEVGVVDDTAVGRVAADVPMTPLAILLRGTGVLAVLVDNPSTGRADLVEINASGLVTRVLPGVAVSIGTSGRFGMAESTDGRLHIVGTSSGLVIEGPPDTFVDVVASSGIEGFPAIAISPSGRIIVGGDDGVLEFLPLSAELKPIRAPAPVTAVAFRDENLIVADNVGVFDTGPLVVAGADPVEVVVVPVGKARVGGDGGPAASAEIGRITVVTASGRRLWLADEASGLIRLIDDDDIIQTVAGDLHPSGPGHFDQAALYGPTTLLAFEDGTVVAHGAHRRVLEIRPADETVTVIYGHPGAISTSPLASLRPLLAPVSSVFLLSSSATPAFGVTTNNRLGRVSQQSPGTWTFELGLNVVGSRLSAVVALDSTRVAATFGEDHCVKILQAGELDRTVFGSCGTAGAFDGFTRSPGALAIAPTGALYVADAGNNRILRRDPIDQSVSVVIGDGSPSSAGRGSPARIFPVNAPGQLAIDDLGNLFIASTTTVRLVADSNGSGDADGDDTVDTIFSGDEPGGLGLGCVTSLTLAAPSGGGPGHDRLWVGDACAGTLIRLDLTTLP